MNGTRRAACDRCHGQKMRCIKENTRPKCNRCLAANADCIFSIGKKAGRPPGSSSLNAPSRRGSGRWARPSPAPSTLAGGLADYPASTFDDQAFFDMPFLDEDITASALFSASADGLPPLPPLESFDEPLISCEASDTTIAADTDHSARYQVKGQHVHDMHTGTSAMQRLAELSGKLFTRVNQRRDSANSDDRMSRLGALVADVIVNSVAFQDIVSRDGSKLLVDTAAILQILTAYIHLTHLHLALYQHMHSILTGGSQSFHPDANPISLSFPGSTLPIPSSFPSLQIGGVSLAGYPRHQLKFILQICVNHLGELEEILGLPAGFCVRDMHTDGGGLLRQDTGSTALLVRTIMRESEDVIHSIRMVLEELREELRSCIQV